jgi:hypothetical protein
MQGLPKYFSAISAKPWPVNLRAAFVSSKGKLLLELVEMLSGKALSVKVGCVWLASSQASPDHVYRQVVPCCLGGAAFRCTVIYGVMHNVLINSWCCSHHDGFIQASRPSANKVEAAQQLVVMYDSVLRALRIQGAMLGAVKPDMLIDQADFDRLMEARTAAAAGNEEEEEALDTWAALESAFDVHAAQAWNTVLLQVSH